MEVRGEYIMYKLKNFTEDMVEDLLDEILQKDNEVCKCEKCRMDIKALALNSLPSRYVVTERGEVFKKAEQFYRQSEVDIMAAILEAVSKVREKPQH